MASGGARRLCGAVLGAARASWWVGGARAGGEAWGVGGARRTAAGLAAAAEDAGEGVTTDALTPSKVVELLDRYIVGQPDAKRAVAVALRNRWRRHQVPSPLREEIVPKNILMIGPTGCGKTEIARRLAKLADAPFIKVEATKFTEVGFHGRDVDQIIRDLVDNSILLTRQKARTRLQEQVAEAVEKKIVDNLTGQKTPDSTRDTFIKLYRNGELDDRLIDIELPDGRNNRMSIDAPGSQMPLQELVIKVDKLMRRTTEKRRMTVAECRPLLEEMEFETLMNADSIAREAITSAENDGIVFIDEIDKIVSSSDHRHGADASSEGVQRDLLPIIEGSTVSTKYGNVNTDHILFVASGAFHQCKPSDMLAELQGRLPIRVELKGLTRSDLYRILTEPETNMLKQQVALMGTEGLTLEFDDEAIREIAAVASEVNRSVDNIGARRLHTILERIMEEISFSAPEKVAAGETHVVIKKEAIRAAVGELLLKTDMSKYVL